MEYIGCFISFVQDYAMQWLGLLVSSVSNVWTCETWNYVEYSSPLVYSKFYSSDINLIMVWLIKS